MGVRNMCRPFVIALLGAALGGCLAQVDSTPAEGNDQGSGSAEIRVPPHQQGTTAPVPWGPNGAPPPAGTATGSGVSTPPAVATAQVTSGATGSTGQAESPR